MDNLKVKHEYLTAHLKYINCVKDNYIVKFCNRLSELNKTTSKCQIDKMLNKDDFKDYSKNNSSVITPIYKKLMLKYHPDKGCNSNIATIINQWRDEGKNDLLELLSELDIEVNNEEDLKLLSEVSEMEDKIKDITACNYWIWNTSGSYTKEYIESNHLTEDEALIYVEDINKGLREWIDVLKKSDENLKSFVKDDIYHTLKKCKDELVRIEEMKIKSKSDIDYDKYEDELEFFSKIDDDYISKSSYETLSSDRDKISNIYVKLKESYSFYRKIWFYTW